MEDPIEDGMVDEGSEEVAESTGWKYGAPDLKQGADDAENVKINYSGEVPAKYTDYRIPDIVLPPELGGHTLNKDAFTKVVHEIGLTQAQAQKLWKAHTDSIMENHEAIRAEVKTAIETEHTTQLNEKIEKVGGYNLTPEEAQAEIDRITTDLNHAYHNDKSPSHKRENAIAYVNRLYEIVAGTETSIEGYLAKSHQERQEQIKAVSSINPPGKQVKSSSGGRSSDDQHSTYSPIGDGTKETKSGYGNKIEDAFE